MSDTVRRDQKGRRLLKGESQRKDGKWNVDHDPGGNYGEKPEGPASSGEGEEFQTLLLRDR